MSEQPDPHLPSRLRSPPGQSAWGAVGLPVVVALLLELSTFWFHRLLPAELGARPLLLLYLLPVTLCAMWRGWVPGLVALLASAGGLAYFDLAPLGELAISHPADRFRWALFVASAALISVLGEVLQRARLREQRLAQALLSANEQLEESQAQFKGSFEQAALGMVMVNLVGQVLRVNQRFCDFVGYSAHEMASLHFPSLTHPDDLPSTLTAIERLLDSQIPFSQLDKRYLRKDGALVWGRATRSLVRDSAGQPLYFILVVEDIQAQLEGQRLQALYSQAFRQSSQALLLCDAQFVITYINPALTELLGYTLDEVVGRHVSHMLAPTEQARAAQARAIAMLEAQGGWSGETVRKARDGRDVPVALNVGPLRDERGQVQGWIGSYNDLTALRAKDAELRLLALAVAQSPSGVVITDLDFNIEFVNDVAVRHAGYSREVLLGMKTSQLTSPAATPQMFVGMMSSLRARRAWHGTVLLRHQQGTDYLLEVDLIPLVQEDGSVTRLVSLGQDVTERESARAELDQYRHRLEDLVAQRTSELDQVNAQRARQQQFLRTVADAFPGLVSYWNPELRCEFANANYATWLGWQAEAALGRHMRELLGDERFALSEARARAALAGERQDFERDTPRIDGRVSQTLVNYIPDVVDGRVRGFSAIIFDITDLKQAQFQLAALNDALGLRAQQAEAATQAKSAFLANMSHEIRTPMNAIIGLTHLMGRDARDALQRERLVKVDSAAKHLLEIINNILDLSKIEAGKMVLERAEFSLDSVLTRCFELVSQKAREKGIELILDTDHLPERMGGDSTRLAQALVNLLGNAVKFTERGWVRLRGDLLSEDRHRLQVRFEVQDTGEGIADAALKSLFSAFEQADSSITRRHGGTGLGLALTHHLVRLMGGEVGVSSVPGEGSRFWFTIWLDRAEQAGQHAAPLPVQGLRALVVDDLPEALATVADRLTLMGLLVDTASTGEQALEQVQAAMRLGQPYDLFLIDLRMAPLDSVETLARLRALLQDGLPPSILFSAFDEPLMWRQAREAHFNAVLVKPVTASALHDAVMQVLRPHAAQIELLATGPGQAEQLLRQRHRGQRVLLAEDNPVNQEVAEALLLAAGLVVEVADNGERAVELACSRDYQLVLMDMQMPVMDGLTAARELRTRLGLGLPIVAMTANAFSDDRQLCLAAGMNDHIAKPVDAEHLYATLLRWLPLPSRSDAPPGLRPVPSALRLDATPPATSVPPSLRQVPGFDLDLGLRAVAQDPATLARVLQVFASSSTASLDRLKAAMDHQDLAQAAAVCHTLRGACATVGAMPLAETLRGLELACKTAPPHDWEALRVQAEQASSALRSLVEQLLAARI
jgi:PAS domain S-box-containing protein